MGDTGMNWTPQEKVTLRWALREMRAASAGDDAAQNFVDRWAASWGVSLEVPKTPQQRRAERQAIGLQRPHRRREG
jgi:hypothetical protein